MYKFHGIQKNTLAGCEIPERISGWRVAERERNLKFYIVVLRVLLFVVGLYFFDFGFAF